MTDPRFNLFYEKVVKPMYKDAERTMQDVPLPDTISEEAKLFLSAATGPIKPSGPMNPELFLQRRTIMNQIWRTTSDCQGLPVSESDETIGGVSCRRFTPQAVASDKRVILYLHGGGYVIGSASANASPAINMADKSGLCVISVDYRLAPEHPFPAGQEDAVAVYRELLSTYEPSQIAIFGDSAGGGLCLSLLIKAKQLDLPQPAALGLISPWTDFTFSGDTHQSLNWLCDPALSVEGLIPSAKAYAGNHEMNNPEISPIFADLSGLPPMIIHVGTREILLSDSTRLAAKARKDGVEAILNVYESMWHVWHFYPGVPEADQAIVEMSEFLCKHMT